MPLMDKVTVGDWEFRAEFEGGTWFHALPGCMAYADEDGRCCYCGAAEPELVPRGEGEA